MLKRLKWWNKTLSFSMQVCTSINTMNGVWPIWIKVYNQIFKATWGLLNHFKNLWITNGFITKLLKKKKNKQKQTEV